MKNSTKLIMVIGQAPPEKDYKYPFKGTRLYSWFEAIELEENYILKYFEFEALVKDFPGKKSRGHQIPSNEKIKEHLPEIFKKIVRNDIKIIIPVGKLAIQYIFCEDKIELNEFIGKNFNIHPFGMGERNLEVIPLPHPSGLNTWVFKKENKILLNNALNLIKLAIKPKS